MPLLLFSACVLAQAVASAAPQPGDPVDVICPEFDSATSPLPATDLAAGATAAAGNIQGSFAVSSNGEATYSMPLLVPPGRMGMQPTLSISYASSAGDGILGMGFSLAGLSVVSRCPQNMAQDQHIRGVRYDTNDALCLDGKRLVAVGEDNGVIEYRTFPDTFTKVLSFPGSNPAKGPATFKAFMRSGLILDYGGSVDTMPLGRKGVIRSWLVKRASDRNENTIDYKYEYDQQDVSMEGAYTTEYAPSRISYTGHQNTLPSRAVKFNYGSKASTDVRKLFAGGMELKSSRQLMSVEMLGPGNALVRKYSFAYGAGLGTGRTILNEIKECAANAICKPPTTFTWYPGGAAFQVGVGATPILVPQSQMSAPMMMDVTGDGLDDLVVPEVPWDSGMDVPRTDWTVAQNFGPPNVGGSGSTYFQSTVVAYSENHNDPDNDPIGSQQPDMKVQPDYGTPIDYNQDGKMDILVHNVHGTALSFPNNWGVLLAEYTPSGIDFVLHDTGIPRPLHLLDGKPKLQNVEASAHLADVNGDGVADLIQCERDPNAGGGAAYQWTLRLWTPAGPGFEQAPRQMSQPFQDLNLFHCAWNIRTVDINADGKVDLVMPDMSQDQTTPLSTYISLSYDEQSNTWETEQIGNLAPSDKPFVFLDVNGDGLPDLLKIIADQPYTIINTGDRHGNRFGSAVHSLTSLPPGGVSAFWDLAAILDYNGDGRQDVLVPLPNPGSFPTWNILQSTGAIGDGTFAVVSAGIPFDAELGQQGITISNRLGPRITDIDGDGMQDVVLPVGGFFNIFRNVGVNPDLLRTVTDGLNAHEPGDPNFVPNLAIQYDTLIDRTVTDGYVSVAEEQGYRYVAYPEWAGISACEYPVRCVVGARAVTGGYNVNNGTGKLRHFDVRYRGGRYDKRGRGFLGFDQLITTDVDAGTGVMDVYDVTSEVNVSTVKIYPYAGQLEGQYRWALNPLPQAPERVETSFLRFERDLRLTNGGATYFVMPTEQYSQQKQSDYIPDGLDSFDVWLYALAYNGATQVSSGGRVVTDYDNYGGVRAETVWSDVESPVWGVPDSGKNLGSEFTRQINNDPALWLIGQVAIQTECSSAEDGYDKCRRTERVYEPDTGLLHREETYDLDELTHLVVIYSRDDFGNITKTTADDTLGNHRASCTSYDADGLFAYAHGNPVGHLSFAKVNPVLGVQTALVDANQLTTKWAYDGFGRMTREQRLDSTETTVTLTRAKNAQNEWSLSVETATTGGDDSSVQYDSLGRPIRWWTQNTQTGPNPQPRIIQEITFDALNERVASRSAPASETAPVASRHYDHYTYDAVGRVLTHKSPWQAVTSYDYDVNTIKVTDPLNHITTIQNDRMGRPATITDARNGVTAYTYTAFGSLLTVTDPGKAVTTTWRDAYGRVKALIDPNRGASSMSYDGFGQVKSSTNAVSRTSTFMYDALGRMTLRQDTPGYDNSPVDSTTWKWDVAPLGVGKVAKGALAAMESPDGVTAVYSYDLYGRLHETQQTIANESFTSTIGYDPQSRVSTVTYPQGLGVAAFTVKNEYDSHGHLIKVWDPANNSGGTVYHWKLTSTDGAGRLTTEALGNDFVTTRGYYDDKNRLKNIYTAKTGLSPVQDLGYTYDAVLNLSSRSDGLQKLHEANFPTEYFQYDELDRLTCASFSSAVTCPTSDSYTYESNGNLSTKPGIAGKYTYDPDHPHAVQTAGSDSFAYDLTGNQTTRSGTVVTYTPFDMPKTFTPAPGQGGAPVKLDYDAKQARVRKAAGNDVTVYFGGLYERTTNTVTNAVEHRYFVHSSGGVVATVTRSPAPAAQDKTRYLHVDNLGSVDTITEQTGSSYSEKRSYDAFGARRNAHWGAAPVAFSSLTKRGFTGHEGDEELGLVNMKGRIYDPHVGRFLTPDRLVSHPGFGQSWNRYSYVLNNPLAYVDPSGFSDDPLAPWSPGCTECVGGKSPDGTVNWVYEPIGPPPPPPPPINSNADSPAAWPVDLSATGNPTASPPQPPADGGTSSGQLFAGNGQELTMAAARARSEEQELNRVRLANNGDWGDPHHDIAWIEVNCPSCVNTYDGLYATGAVFMAVQDLRQLANVLRIFQAPTPRGGLDEARAARDALARELAPLRGKAPATVTGGYNTNTGQVAASACGGHKCAEDNVVDALGGVKEFIRFTEAVRPRTGAEVPVCERCEGSYGREPFPLGTRFKTDE